MPIKATWILYIVQLSSQNIISFQRFIWDFYHRDGRLFVWRKNHDPYFVFVSEIMLQQTQTYRVEPKFEQFIEAFPTVAALADANLRDVLFVWQGLGYNRRAMALHMSAKRVMQEFDGQLPACVETLQTFRGIGYATASSICAFSFNMPTVFIETNIRAVFIHTFFQDSSEITDKQLMPLVQQTLDYSNPREWYYALMDYGVHLKKTYKNPARRSAHHAKQSRFEGSDRQIRGAIVRHVTHYSSIEFQELVRLIASDQQRIESITQKLIAEGLITREGDMLGIGQS